MEPGPVLDVQTEPDRSVIKTSTRYNTERLI